MTTSSPSPLPEQAKTPILLLKTGSLPTDPYQTLLSSTPSYTPSFHPVLTHTFSPSSLSELHDLFNNPATFLEKYTAGIVLTSQRAVEGLDSALSSPSDSGISRVKGIWEEYASSTTGVQLQFYVVGPATHLSVSNLTGKHFPNSLVRISGHETGTGEALVEFILSSTATTDNSSPQSQSQSQRILFPTGEKRRDTIPRVLTSRGWVVDEIPCYETVTRSEFLAEISDVLAYLRSEQGLQRIWIVVFSPQGCKEFLLACGWISDDGRVRDGYATPEERRRKNRVDAVGGSWIRVCAIGPTTQRHLMDEFGVEVDVVCRIPSAEGVRDAIGGADADEGGKR